MLNAYLGYLVGVELHYNPARRLLVNLDIEEDNGVGHCDGWVCAGQGEDVLYGSVEEEW